MKRAAAVWIAVVVALVAAPSRACDCAPVDPASIDAIFAARVVAVDADVATAEVQVERVWKGFVGTSLVIDTDHSNCGASVETGRTTLFFARRNESGWHTDQCLHTGPIEWHCDTIERLGTGYPPGSGWMSIGVASLALILVLLRTRRLAATAVALAAALGAVMFVRHGAIDVDDAPSAPVLSAAAARPPVELQHLHFSDVGLEDLRGIVVAANLEKGLLYTRDLEMKSRLCVRPMEEGAAPKCIEAPSLQTVRVSPDAAVLAARFEGTLTLRDPLTLERVATIGDDSSLGWFTSDGGVVTTEKNGKIVTWREHNGRASNTLEANVEVPLGFIGDGPVVAVRWPNADESGWWRDAVQVLERDTGKATRRFTRRCSGGTIASGGPLVLWERKEGAEVFDANDGAALGIIPRSNSWMNSWMEPLVTKTGFIVVNFGNGLEFWGGRPLARLARDPRDLEPVAISDDGKRLVATQRIKGDVFVFEMP